MQGLRPLCRSLSSAHHSAYEEVGQQEGIPLRRTGGRGHVHGLYLLRHRLP